MEKLLRKEEIAAMLGTSSGVAASVLEQRGVYAIDWGKGRGRGPRWLESAVDQAIREIHSAAQPQSKASIASGRKPKPPNVVGLANMSVSDVLNLTNRPCVQ